MKSSIKNTQNFGLVNRFFNSIKLWFRNRKLFFIRSVAHSNNRKGCSESVINNNPTQIFVEGNWVRYVNLTDNISFMISHDNFIQMYNEYCTKYFPKSHDGKVFKKLVISNRNSSDNKDSSLKE
ncbi:hypothetical protein GCM10007963_23070 [Lutibacter litoralis]|nr:hypothetical protein GCM10007963_23070 [Lutibacter litoralis]